MCFDAFMKQVNMYWFVFSEIYLQFLCQQVFGVLFLGFLINDVIDYRRCNIIILKSERSYECCCYLPFNLLYKWTSACECICCTSGLFLDILGGQEECVWTPSNSLHKPLFSHETPLLPYVFSSSGTKVIGFYSWRWHLFFALQTLTTGIWMEHGSELWWTYCERKLVVVDISKNLTTFLNNTFEDLLPFSWILCNMIFFVL